MSDPSRVRIAGPLAAFAAGFGEEFCDQGYRPNAVASQFQPMAHLSGWLVERGLDTSALTPVATGEFLSARRAEGYTLWLSPKALPPLQTYPGTLDVVPPSLAPLIPRLSSLVGAEESRSTSRPWACQQPKSVTINLGVDGGSKWGLMAQHLLVRLGLRAGEASAPELDDFHWRIGEVGIRGKGNRIERLPLPVDVGEAVVSYLQQGVTYLECRAPWSRGEYRQEAQQCWGCAGTHETSLVKLRLLTCPLRAIGGG